MHYNQLHFLLRYLRSDKASFFINVLGLAFGIALFIIIALYVSGEHRFDKFNEKLDQIYRLEGGRWTVMAAAHGPAAKENFPEVQEFVRFDVYEFMESTLATESMETGYKIPGFMFADEQIFDVFTIPFIEGNPQTALQKPNSLVLTESAAKKLFGQDDPMDQTVRINQEHTFRVTGVIEDLDYFHLNVSMLGSFSSLASIKSDPDFFNRYGGFNYPTYLLLKEGADVLGLEKKMTRFYKEIWQKKKDRELSYEMALMPVKEIYLDEDREFKDYTRHGSSKLISVFSVIAVFILLIASVNFVNLSTARAASRAREIGLKKVLGGRRRQLIRQFLSESVLITFLGFLGALVLIELFLPSFNHYLQGNIAAEYYLSPLFWAFSLAGVLILGVLSGLYPSFYLTRFQPITILNRVPTSGRKGVGLRKTLTIFQFLISVVLILGTITIYRQIQYMKNKNPGFNEENQVYFTIDRDHREHKQAIKSELLKNPNIKYLSWVHQPAGLITSYAGIRINGERKQYKYQQADPDYMRVMDFQIREGENFSWDKPSQKNGNAILLNETAVRHFGLEDPVGTILQQRFRSRVHKREVIGVIKDFHFTSLHHEIDPLMVSWENTSSTANIRISGTDVMGTIEEIEKVWKAFFPETPFEIHFVDETMQSLYKDEERLASLFILFAGFAIFIACMGMYGLSLFSAERRKKEVGIRKVNGAHAGQILQLFIKDFAVVVLIANALALPVGVFIMDRWLRNFAYHVGVEWWILLASLFVSVGVAVLTVSYTTVKAANTNPALILRDE